MMETVPVSKTLFEETRDDGKMSKIIVTTTAANAISRNT
jgi:hypothetical protein